MKYIKADAILPESLLAEIQEYVQGQNLYIPKPKNAYAKWGTRSGSKKKIEDRNNNMKQSFYEGKSVQEIANEHYLSVETVKKIVYGKS